MNSALLLRRPSALIPLAMSATALATVVVHVAMFGTARQADEGTAAHLWQLLMAAQLPVIAFFLSSGCRLSPGAHCWFLRSRSARRSPRCSRSGGSSGDRAACALRAGPRWQKSRSRGEAPAVANERSE